MPGRYDLLVCQYGRTVQAASFNEICTSGSTIDLCAANSPINWTRASDTVVEADMTNETSQRRFAFWLLATLIAVAPFMIE